VKHGRVWLTRPAHYPEPLSESCAHREDGPTGLLTLPSPLSMIASAVCLMVRRPFGLPFPDSLSPHTTILAMQDALVASSYTRGLSGNVCTFPSQSEEA